MMKRLFYLFSYYAIATSVGSREDDGAKAREEEEEHEHQQPTHRTRCPPELSPDKDAPQRSHHRRSLSQGIGDGRTGLARCNVAECCTQSPDDTTQDTYHVGTQATTEIGGIGHGLALKGAAHHNGIEHEIAKEDTHGKDEEGRVGASEAIFSASFFGFVAER